MLRPYGFEARLAKDQADQATATATLVAKRINSHWSLPSTIIRIYN
ncbi:hypothetical protein EDF70_12034 [Neorhizobium sp. JUb45]|nr:hypothetical protein EDF70_12034 [Neorhizobium sp. JUb45]